MKLYCLFFILPLFSQVVFAQEKDQFKLNILEDTKELISFAEGTYEFTFSRGRAVTLRSTDSAFLYNFGKRELKLPHGRDTLTISISRKGVTFVSPDTLFLLDRPLDFFAKNDAFNAMIIKTKFKISDIDFDVSYGGKHLNDVKFNFEKYRFTLSVTKLDGDYMWDILVNTQQPHRLLGILYAGSKHHTISLVDSTGGPSTMISFYERRSNTLKKVLGYCFSLEDNIPSHWDTDRYILFRSKGRVKEMVWRVNPASAGMRSIHQQ